MSDVFISYKREDEARVRRLYDALVRAGLSVWWDLETEGGEVWRRRIEKELGAASCVVVVWSEASVGEEGSAFVWDEAARGLQRGVLLPVRIEKVSPPLGFGEFQALDLVGWNGAHKDRRILDVVASVRAIVAKQPRPRPTWPSWRRRRIMALSAVGVTPVVVILALLLQPALQRAVCAVPGIRRLCPSPENCFRWVPGRRVLTLYVQANEPLFPTEAEAKADTLRQALAEAQEACSKLASPFVRVGDAAYEFKNKDENQSWKCATRSSGHCCSFDASAICTTKERVRAMAGDCEPPSPTEWGASSETGLH